MYDLTLDALLHALDPITSRANTMTYWYLPAGASQPRRAQTGLLTAALLRGHLIGDPHPRIGLAQMLPGTSVTRLAVLDFDSHAKGGHGSTPWPDMQATALRVADAMQRRGVAAIPFRSSGGRGIHLYAIWDEPQDAYSVRELLADALADCGLRNGAKGVAFGQVEIFPKQDALAPGDWGNMVYLPLAKYSLPLDWMDMSPLEDRMCAIDMPWPLSYDVPLRERPVGVVATISRPLVDIVGEDQALQQVAAALEAIPNASADELDYDQWFSAMAGTHNACGGTDEGLALFQQFSGKSTKYNPELTEYKWRSLSLDRGAGAALATADTLFNLARPFGFMLDIKAEFEALAPIEGADGEEKLPPLIRDKKGSLATLPNVRKALNCFQLARAHLMVDSFTQTLMVSNEAGSTANPREFRDEDYTTIQMALEEGMAKFQPISERTLVRGVAHVALEHQFDSAQLWLNSLKWDGVPRVRTFLSRYFRTEASPYTEALALYWWSAAAGRVLDPGCQADIAPVLVGGEGVGKSRGIQELVPDYRYFCEVDLHDNEAETGRRLRGKLIGEIAELRGIYTKDREAILRLLTRREDAWTPKYVEHARSAPRRVLFIGTTNDEAFLKGEAGERRWCPVMVGQVDIPALQADRLQLWAEGAALFTCEGVMWAGLEGLAKEHRAEFKQENSVVGALVKWLEASEMGEDAPSARDYLHLDDVIEGVYRKSAVDVRGADKNALIAAMREVGYRSGSNNRVRIGGIQTRVWRKEG